MNLKEAVKRGAAWLDANHPGWREKINLAELEMEHCSKCILGQLFGDYDPSTLPGWETGWDNNAPQFTMGFSAFEAHSNDNRWHELSYLWKKEIRGH